LPLDAAIDTQHTTTNATQTVECVLSQVETSALLRAVVRDYDAKITDVLLTALMQAYTSWTGSTNLLLELIHHGRGTLFEDTDLSRTVGWINTGTPVILELAETDDLPTAVASIKSQLRAIPNQGIGYQLLRYVRKDQSVIAQLTHVPHPEVVFNYLGRVEQSFDDTTWPLRKSTPAQIEPLHHATLYCFGMISQERLRISWIYREQLHRQATIEQLAKAFMTALRFLTQNDQERAS
jgi:non-ribosomal peptide synthase protein (TIGR01720 family)